jgi:hypothetical protein
MVILVSGRSLIEVLDRLDEVPDDATLHATKPWSSASPTAVSDDDCPPTGFALFDVLDPAELTTLRNAAQKISARINRREQQAGPRKDTAPQPPHRDATP